MKKTQKIIIGVIAALVVIAGAGFGVYQYTQKNNEDADPYDKVREEVVKEVPEETEEKESVEIPIDFAALQQQNPEAYAWIRIPGTDIDYPILQSETDDLFYLTHSIDKVADANGAVFTQKTYNNKDFEDANTVLYGHNMRSGAMFQNLHQYEDRSFFDANREIIIYLPGEIRTYKIFAAYLYDDRHIMHEFNFSDPAVYQEYLNSIYAMRGMNDFVDSEVQVTTEDKIITLSTCDGVDQNSRYLVQAVLVSINN